MIEEIAPFEEKISVEVTLNVTLRRDDGGWWYAQSRVGCTNSATKEDCIRILKERVLKSF